MPLNFQSEIVIKGARTNNLKDISLRIPHNKFIVVTGVSGSGKSSLVFDIIAKEGQRRYFETLPSFARQFLGKLNRPDVDEIEGLSPVIAIGQRTSGMHARSTVGTMSDLYDLLRLLYARTGTSSKAIKLSRALFSFNSALGKCRRCNGIGKEEVIDIQKLVSAPDKTIRDGALAPTLPNGYIMYSQVTIDVLNQVCEAEGFNVDIPWNELTTEQRQVVLYGSEKIKVPFGKHSLESRLKWTGIKAKPREEGHYKGMIPIMSDILRRDRNANILKYVHAVTCPSCAGTRLNEDALSVKVHSKSIAEISTFELNELRDWIRSNAWGDVAQAVIEKIESQVELLQDLGLGHLTLDRPANSLRLSEIQRIRVANQLLVSLSDVLYVFDEPSIGLHPEENQRLLYHFKRLVKKGNTVIVVEHDLDTIRSADHLIEIGPGAGVHGGEVIFNGALEEFSRRTSRSIAGKENLQKSSPTYRAIHGLTSYRRSELSPKPVSSIKLLGCHKRNLKHIDVEFKLGGLNVVSGPSGAGKSSLVKGTLLKAVREQLKMEVDEPAKLTGHENLSAIDKLIFVDHSPIGKTPRSNPATYLGISDHIRDLFARQQEAKDRKYTKSRFSFNNKGGRCETCQGAGKTQIGMHFLGNVDLVCGTCNGDRFNEATLQVKYQGKSIADVYKLPITEAVSFFAEEKRVVAGLKILQEIGLGYLTLGQSSTTLSGGEAQRIKIANQLQKKDTGNTLYVIIEPSIGLHQNDIRSLLTLFDRITEKGNTIVCIEQDASVIQHADWHIELGPKSGVAGGKIAYQGFPREVRTSVKTTNEEVRRSSVPQTEVVLKGVTTPGLKNIDVRIPKNQLTVVTGLSGSGKSSLVYDTLFAEANARFTESLSTYNRSFLQQNSVAEIASYTGLGPAIGINRKGGSPSKRSTVGTLSGVYDAFRLLYSRIAQHQGKPFTAQHFSFNHHLGACPVCEGMGVKRKCDPDSVIVDRRLTIFNGALSTNKAVRYYGDPNGQFMATLREVAKQNEWTLDQPWGALDDEIKQVILYGTGEKEWDVTWHFQTKLRSGTQVLKVKWLGLCNYIDEEYQRKISNKNIAHLEALLHEVECPCCKGSRLKNELLSIQFRGFNIHKLCSLSILSCLNLIDGSYEKSDRTIEAIGKVVLPAVKTTIQTIVDLGLGYLTLDRSVKSLSGGERQRITLAGQLSTHLYGVIYVLDEPTIGLDAAQIEVLAKALKRIIANGNTVVVVEHDPTFIQKADYIIEMGPGAGIYGGEVVYQGLLSGLDSVKNSVTYGLIHALETLSKSRKQGVEGAGEKSKLGEVRVSETLSKSRKQEVDGAGAKSDLGELRASETLSKSRKQTGALFGIKAAIANNLKSIDVDFLTGQTTAITGVSGSGKSSLIKEVLYRSWQQGRPVHCAAVHGFEQFEEVLYIDQAPLAQRRLSTPVSVTGILDDLKASFAKTEQAKFAGLKKADFSYLSKNGKCLTCAGRGKLKTSMDFMSDIWLTCDGCKGLRYSDPVLSIKLNARSIGEVLQMTVTEAIAFFTDQPLLEKLKVLLQVGVGHLRLGQAGNTLSGGESQRLKLAKAMLEKRKGAILFIFDEPSTGLHHFDILKLIKVFQSLVDRGDTVLFIEHNRTFLAAADMVVTLGPGSGADGGKLVR